MPFQIAEARRYIEDFESSMSVSSNLIQIFRDPKKLGRLAAANPPGGAYSRQRVRLGVSQKCPTASVALVVPHGAAHQWAGFSQVFVDSFS